MRMYIAKTRGDRIRICEPNWNYFIHGLWTLIDAGIEDMTIEVREEIL